ncbi:MAG: hypothetical protein JRI80_16580 [Deltaproteobacteria bacterium]|nr:hypothetical protein [Deltaproteobacteria bacterium]
MSIHRDDFIKQNLDLCGILNAPFAFSGPGIAQIDLTNNCNNACIACWCHSPMLGDQKMPLDEKKKQLPWKVIESLIHDLS